MTVVLVVGVLVVGVLVVGVLVVGVLIRVLSREGGTLGMVPP